MNHPNEPTDPASNNTPWEEAMSRDFDARVRHLHEAPLDLDSVKGKAHKIQRNRRAAVAGGILGVAAIVTPFAVLANDNGDARSKEPDFADPSETTEVVDPAASVDYVVNGTWHQADGDVVQLPKSDQAYDAAVLWNDQLVATRWDGEVFSIADVIDAEGNVVETFETTSGVSVNEAGTTIAWIDTDGTVVTAWGPGDSDQVSIGTVDLAAPGDTVAWSVAAVTGGPDCNEEADGCIVYVNSALGEESRSISSHGINDIVAGGVTKVFDATTDGAVSVINEVTEDLNTCGGILDLVDTTIRWSTCEHQVQQISPDGNYAAAPQSQYDGLGPARLSILDTATSEPTAASFERDGWFVGTWAWSTNSTLTFTAYDGARWHLMAMAPDGVIADLGKIPGEDVDSPFTLIQH